MWLHVALNPTAVKCDPEYPIPYVDGEPSDNYFFDEKVAQALEKDGFLSEMWHKFDATFDWGDYDYFDYKKCITFRQWLIERLKSPTNTIVKPVYDTMLDYANKAIKYHTGIGFDFQRCFMKSTYKLLSIQLDGLPLPSCPPKIIFSLDLNSIEDLNTSFNLFDYDHCIRRVNCSSLLKTNSFSEIDAVVSKVPECTKLILVADECWYAKVMNELYIRRVLQVYAYLDKKCPNLQLEIYVPKDSTQKLFPILKQMKFSQNKKTR